MSTLTRDDYLQIFRQLGQQLTYLPDSNVTEYNRKRKYWTARAESDGVDVTTQEFKNAVRRTKYGDNSKRDEYWLLWRYTDGRLTPDKWGWEDVS